MTATPLTTCLHELHLELGARMVPFAGYSMPVQYPSGLMAEHKHTREAAGLFDVSHMGQIVLRGDGAAAAFESLMPMDVIDLPPLKQRYGLLTTDSGGIMDDLMFIKRACLPQSSAHEIFVIVNGACKAADIVHMQARIGSLCDVITLTNHGLFALQGPQAVAALTRLIPGVDQLVFMTGDWFSWQSADLFITRSGYTGEDGFEISVTAEHAQALARALLALPEVKPIGLGARNSLRLEAGLCLYGHDIDTTTDPVQAALTWAIQKVRCPAGAREGGYPGATHIGAVYEDCIRAEGLKDLKKRVGLIAQERIPVRDGAPLSRPDGTVIGHITSGLLSPSMDQPIAMGYVPIELSASGTLLHAIVRGKAIPMTVSAMPFVPSRYHRGAAK